MPTETLMMKDSGIDCIAEIPENWEVKRLKFILNNDFNNMRVGPFGTALTDSDFKESGYWVYNQRCVLDNNFDSNDVFINEQKYRELKSFKVFPNDILITTRGTIGKVAIVPENIYEGVLHPCLIRFVVNSDCINNDFIKYIFNDTNIAMQQIMNKSNSTTIEVIYSYNLKDIYLVIPPIEEQQAIADFLDEKCEKIDKVIGEIEEQIQILEDYKKSLITETVTKGLDKNVPMKDSGIDWIGEIPKNWEISRIKYDALFYNGDRSEEYPSGNDIVDEGIPFVNSENIHDTFLDLTSCKCITDEKYKRLGGAKLKINDIIFCLRGSVGNCAINKSINEGTVASSLVAIRANNINPDFLNYYLNSDSTVFQTALFQNGSCAANLSAEKVSNYYICIPTLKEQEQIADYLDKECAKIDTTINDKKEQLETIKEYKKSLIYEYVTGKKRVAC